MTMRMIRSVEDLEVFRRAYRLSVELHKISLELPRIEQFALGRSVEAGVEIDLRQSDRRLCQAESFCGGVSSICGDRDRQQ